MRLPQKNHSDTSAQWRYGTQHVVDTNCVFLLHCEDNAASTVVTDACGDNQATVANSNTYSDTGKFNLGFHTDRTANNCIIGDASLKATLNTVLAGNCTIEVWAKNDTTDWSVVGAQKLFQFYKDGNNYGGMAYESATDKITFQTVFGGTVKQIEVNTVGVIDTNTWHHYAFVFSESAHTLKAFIDGVQVGATQTACGTYAGGTVNFRLFTNHDATTQVWDGIVDEFAISNVARY